MAIAHDFTTNAAAYTLTGTQTTSHAANASAMAAVVLVAQDNSTADQVSAITYGGAAMTRLGFSINSTESGAVYIYFLDNISGGTQNVAMTTTASAEKYLSVSTLTVAAATKVSVAGVGYQSANSTSASNPALTLTGLTASVPVTAYQVIHSGLQTMTNTPQTTPAWTLVQSVDIGTSGFGMARIANTPVGTTLTAGWIAATADDYVISGAAFFEDDKQFLDVAGITDTGGMGTPVSSVGPITLVPPAIPSDYVFGNNPVGYSTVTVIPTGIADTGGMGTPTSLLISIHTPTGIADTGGMGTPVAQLGYPQTLASAGNIASPSAVGTPVAIYSNVSYVAGIPSSAALGTPVGFSTASLTVTGIATTSVVPTPVLGAPIRLTAVGIDDSASNIVGTPNIVTGPATLFAIGIATSSIVSTPLLAQVEESWGFLQLI